MAGVDPRFTYRSKDEDDLIAHIFSTDMFRKTMGRACGAWAAQ
jgi:hypothetical protein